MAKQTQVTGLFFGAKRRGDGLVKYHISYPDVNGIVHNTWTNWMVEQDIAVGDNVQIQIKNRNANVTTFNNVAQHKDNKVQIALIAGAAGFAAGCAVCMTIATFSIIKEIKPTVKLVNAQAQRILHKFNK